MTEIQTLIAKLTLESGASVRDMRKLAELAWDEGYDEGLTDSRDGNPYAGSPA